MKMGAWPAMAPDTVRFVGQAVAVVIAETKNQAKDAAEAVVVDYEELPAVADIRAAIKPGAPQLHPEAPGNVVYDWTIGDEAAVKEAFGKAANVVTLELTNNRLVPNAMEPRAAIAEYDEAEEHFTLYTTSQNPHVARLVLSAFYNVAQEHKLRVIAPDVGGGFGSKIYHLSGRDGGAVGLQKSCGRPVKWTGDRTEAFLTDAHGRDHMTRRPRWRSTRTTRLWPCGSRPTPISAPTCRCSRRRCRPISTPRCCRASTTFPAIYAEVMGVYTNTTPVDAYRGAGRPEASYLVERMMETAARQLKVDPTELRRQNFITSSRTRRP